ncbi:MAG: transposase [Phycisphaerales bacterium]|nr:transposase [Phycisphaerales bacterium]
MPLTRYAQSRTLTRRLCCKPGQARSDFKANVRRLRTHFEQFNVDTSELCQWFMGLRKRFGDAASPASFGVLGDFLLQPDLSGMVPDAGPAIKPDEGEADIWRLRVFDHVAGFRSIDNLSDHPIPPVLSSAMTEAGQSGQSPGNTTAARLFKRLRALQPAHRLVLLKSAAEWIVARYRRGVENWGRQSAEWGKEKTAWEQAHPQLTPELRDRFTAVFKSLNDPQDADTSTGVRRKNPRICKYERLADNTDNCCYAGSKGHGPLCWAFAAFLKERGEKEKRFNKKKCIEDLVAFVNYCREKQVSNPGKLFQSPHLGKLLFKDKDPRQQADLVKLLKSNWEAYLKAMNLTQDTVMRHGCLPHCITIGDCFEKSKCLWNPHTELCLEYKRRLLAEFDNLPDLARLEGLYRDWRALYLAGPRKPSFRYPSSSDLPMPKIFGKDFYEVDFERSILRLRLDDMAEGEWIEYGFTPWPRGYSPSRKEIADRISSIHVQFSGTRVRVGFHFTAPHATSRITVSQDELEELRSRVYPRQAQDKEFLAAARKRILTGRLAEEESSGLRVLAVDMGIGGAHVAIYEGTRCLSDEPLLIHKIDKLYDQLPAKDPPGGAPKGAQKNPSKGEPEQSHEPDTRGLRKEHVGRHLQTIADGASALAEHRQKEEDDPTGVLRQSDFRGLKRHIAWMARDWARLNARQIIERAAQHRCDLIVFESLRGHRVPGFDKIGQEADRKKQEMLLYAFGRVRRKVTEKAVERGMRVVTVPYFKSSQICAKCGNVQENIGLWRKNKRAGKFICDHAGCKFKANSDANAARVVARVFWGEIVLPDRRAGG